MEPSLILGAYKKWLILTNYYGYRIASKGNDTRHQKNKDDLISRQIVQIKAKILFKDLFRPVTKGTMF